MQCPRVDDIDSLLDTRKKKKNEAIQALAGNVKKAQEAESKAQADHLKELQARAANAAINTGASSPYEVLGVDSSTSSGEIRKAYRR